MTRRAAFTEADVARVLRAAARAQLTVRSLEIAADGRIVAQFGAAEDSAPAGGDDEWRRRIDARREARAAAQRH